jgi:hypothetical protein
MLFRVCLRRSVMVSANFVMSLVPLTFTKVLYKNILYFIRLVGKCQSKMKKHEHVLKKTFAKKRQFVLKLQKIT